MSHEPEYLAAKKLVGLLDDLTDFQRAAMIHDLEARIKDFVWGEAHFYRSLKE